MLYQTHLTLSILLIAYILYLSYLDFVGEKLPSVLVDMFNNVLIRLIILIGVALLAYRGMLMGALLLAVVFLLSVSTANCQCSREIISEYLTNPDQDQLEEEDQKDQESEFQEEEPSNLEHLEEGFTPSGSGCFGGCASVNAMDRVQPHIGHSLVKGVPNPLPPSGDNFFSNPSGEYAHI